MTPQPQGPMTFKLQNGETVTLSQKEMNHPDFQEGWRRAEQGVGTRGKKKPLMILGLSAYYVFSNDMERPLQTSMTAEKIHARFAGKRINSGAQNKLNVLSLMKIGDSWKAYFDENPSTCGVSKSKSEAVVSVYLQNLGKLIMKNPKRYGLQIIERS